MGKRFAFVIGVAALGAALIAVGASANFSSVDDPRGDTKCFHDRINAPCSDRAKRDADIVRATAGHAGPPRRPLRHTIRVVGKIQSGYLALNTDSDPRCEWLLLARRGQVRTPFRECFTGTESGGRAKMDFHRHSVEIFFNKRGIIGDPRSYGWRASDCVGPAAGHACDHVPNGRRRYIRHRFG